MESNEIDYEAEVKKMHPKAKCYHTGNILGGHLKVYHIGVLENGTINVLVPSHLFAGNKKKAYQFAYEHLFTNNDKTSK